MAESSSAYKLRKNCVDSQIKKSSDNREKIDLCQKYDGTQIAERGESSFLYLRKVGALVLMPEKYMSKSKKKSQDEK